MSKTKGKKGKKTESQDTVPTKTVFDILLDQYKDPQSLSLAQQKYIIKVLGLSDTSLYDGISIVVITDCIRYCMKCQLKTNQIEIIYRILQNTLYKIKNEIAFEEEQLKEYLNQQLSTKLPIKSVEDTDPNKSKVDQETLDAIQTFIAETISSEYTVYRAALFKNNPSNIQYEEFKNSMDVGNVVKFHTDQYLSQIKEFRDNYVVLQLLDKENEIEFIVSKDQTRFLKFVSKAPSEADKEADKEMEDQVCDQPVDANEVDQVDDNDIVDTVQNMNMENEEVPKKEKTLLDMIVQQRVDKELQSMQKELDQYKQQINELKSNPNKM